MARTSDDNATIERKDASSILGKRTPIAYSKFNLAGVKTTLTTRRSELKYTGKEKSKYLYFSLFPFLLLNRIGLQRRKRRMPGLAVAALFRFGLRVHIAAQQGA